MSLPKLTKEDIFIGATLVCTASATGRSLFTKNKSYNILQYNGVKWGIEDDDNDRNNLYWWSTNEFINTSNVSWSTFTSYSSLTDEQKFLFQLHRDVDRL